jgi:bla regulator protein blaR1
MITALTNHLWQSTLFGAIAALLTLVLRKNHAAARYWLWLAASVKFLVPFALLINLGSHWGWHKAQAQATVALAIDQFSRPFAPMNPAAVARVTTSAGPSLANLIPILIVAVWSFGCIAVLLAWWMRWRRVAAIVRAAKPLQEGREVEALHRLEQAAGLRVPIEIVSSAVPIEPGVFGIWRPILLWPAGISSRLADAQLDAILAHEIVHVRRRDNLAAALHMSVEALFWFHPLVWWIGARLVEEREIACDSEVLRLQTAPEVYAEGVLKVCEYCVEAPLLCVSGVSGADLKKRIQGIMSHRVAHDLGLARRLLLIIAGVAAIAVPIGIGLINAPASQAESRAAATSRLAFEVASIRPHKGMYTVVRSDISGPRVRIVAYGLTGLIMDAYHLTGSYEISGGPSWRDSDSARFDIDATAPGGGTPTGEDVRRMLQTLLADRFQLKVHRETKEGLVYALVVAKNGPKLKESAPDEEFSVTAGGDRTAQITMANVTMERLAIQLADDGLNRPVLDKTGLTGHYDLKLNWIPEFDGPPPTGSDGVDIFTALQEQLGLKLEAQRGQVETLVIDHVEKPSEN